ncbi:ATP-binding protein [Cohnella suwonensis]|uniref:histidine kinase n=1 Tax=Cohnella suwonensis TaxID=696072 RepID=A0ABW0LTX1_9BACL
MKHVPFKVSARAARLIGRENVSNADGAIIELIKNGYDADATACLIIFDIKYNQIPKKLTLGEFHSLELGVKEEQLLQSFYKVLNGFYELKTIDESQENQLLAIFRRQNRIYIIDNGDGMSDEIIENNWMTIGTNNKEVDFESKKKRVRTGAKGIGRFALDRLGNQSRMITIPRGNFGGFDWKVRWSDFERQGANLDQVFAQISNTSYDTFFLTIEKILSIFPNTSKVATKKKFSQGTIIEISELRDNWNSENIQGIYKNLEILTPPQDSFEFEYFEDEAEDFEGQSDRLEEIEVDNYAFKMYLHSTMAPKEYGRIRTSICDDFDYKLSAEYNENQELIVTIHRNEFNVELLDKRLFEYPQMKQWPFNKETFETSNSFTKKYTLPQLMPGNLSGSLDNIGPFQFTVYFMKRSLQQDDKERLFQREFPSSTRSEWLDSFGGIKMFRDSFRVRPYGEAGGSSFDWLTLGERAAKSPAGVTHKSGSWKVRPNQVAGLIRISRILNLNFEDKSSREGIQETPEFQTFKVLLLRIIQLFEDDRQAIMRLLNQLYEEVNEQELNKDKAKKVAEKVVLESARSTTNNTKEEVEKNQNERSFLAKQVLAFSRERDELITELKLLKGLASTGLVITSFAHELKNLSANILPRTQDLRAVLQKIISNDTVQKLKSYNNPYIMIDDFRNQDQRLKHWLDIALNVIRKDKRTRKKVDLYMMFEEYERTWSAALAFQSVELIIPKSNVDKTCLFRMFPIDFDSVFNNLLSNSLDAFQRKDAPNSRQITIGLEMEDGKIVFTYEDSGPGLLATIDNPYKIFESFFTTKLDAIGRPVGTGLGMWIVKTTIDEYRGQVELVKARPGFKLKIKLPVRKDEGIVNHV